MSSNLSCVYSFPIVKLLFSSLEIVRAWMYLTFCGLAKKKITSADENKTFKVQIFLLALCYEKNE